MKSARMLLAAIFTGLLGSSAQGQTCFELAGLRHGVAPDLLLAIAKQESSMRFDALNSNRDGSVDIGLMQINSRWLPQLARYGITAQALFDPCTNVEVGAWILAANFRRYGVNWNGLGAYNANAPVLRARYARSVIARLPALSTPATSSACALHSQETVC